MRIGIDLGGTKIEGVLLGAGGAVLARKRVPTPKGDYAATVAQVVVLVQALDQAGGRTGLPLGVGSPGSISAVTGAMKNCNSTCLIGRHFREDLQAALGREIRLANDADCLALSEATDGAAAGAGTVFAGILGTGVGGGVVIAGRLLQGANGIAGEWGHNLMPGLGGLFEDERRRCYCGRLNCIETYLCGGGLSQTFARLGGDQREAIDIAAAASAGDSLAVQALHLYQRQLGCALAQVVNLLDPHVIVLGGGLSRIASLYEEVPRLWGEHIFTDAVQTRLVPAVHGDSSGVFGAARLWPEAGG
jgi:predicted NBD/HSP70 family sugar kinase